MSVFAKTVAERTRPGVRQDIEEKSYTFHCYGSTAGVAGLIISDAEYPALVAHQLLSKIVDEFTSTNPRSSYSSTSVIKIPYPQLKDYIVKYQDPNQADSIMKVQRELDETKIVLHKTIESVLERGEKIDSLVQKSVRRQKYPSAQETDANECDRMVCQHNPRCSTSKRRSRTRVVLLCRTAGKLKTGVDVDLSESNMRSARSTLSRACIMASRNLPRKVIRKPRRLSTDAIRCF